MRSRLLTFLVAAFAILTTCAAPALAQQSAEARGEVLLSEHCGMCHAVGRSGTSPNSQAPTFRMLGQRYPLDSLESALGKGLITGHPAMPEFTFPPHAVDAIIRYLRSIQDR